MSNEIAQDELASKRLDGLVIEVDRIAALVTRLAATTKRVIDRTEAELRREIQEVKGDMMIEVECMMEDAPDTAP
jgi:hypothetical protein